MSDAPACSGTGSRITSQSGRQAGDVSREPLFQAAVERRRRARREDRVAALHRHAREPAAQARDGRELEARAPGEVRQQLGEGAPVDQRVAEQRERPRDVQARKRARLGRQGDVAEQAAKLREPHDRPQPALDAQRQVRRAHHDRLREREVRVQRDLGRRRDRIGRAHRRARRADRRTAPRRAHPARRRAARRRRRRRPRVGCRSPPPRRTARRAPPAAGDPTDRRATAWRPRRRSRGSRSETAPGSPRVA